jgi:two-component system, sensor histidine kinase and response regulator
LLEHWGHEVVVAKDGREAVELWQTQPFDLILMDVQMPETDGFEATQAIRQHEQTSGSRVPIIALTAHALIGDREKCLAAGMDGYVAKPVRSHELYEALRPYFVSRISAPPAPDVDPDRIPAVAWEAALHSVAGNRGLLKQVIEKAVGELPRLLQQLEEALHAGEMRAARRFAHSIKSAVRIFAAQRAASRAEEIEELGDVESLDHALERCEYLRAEINRLLAELRNFQAAEHDPSS